MTSNELDGGWLVALSRPLGAHRLHAAAAGRPGQLWRSLHWPGTRTGRGVHRGRVEIPYGCQPNVTLISINTKKDVSASRQHLEVTVKRRTTVAVVGGLAGSALVVGLRLALPGRCGGAPSRGWTRGVAQPVAAPNFVLPHTRHPHAWHSGAVQPDVPDLRWRRREDQQTRIGAVTVTLALCDKALATATSSQTQSQLGANPKALKAMDTLTLKYYAIDISKIAYSGATLTSQAYRASLTSAMTKAG